MRFGVFSIFLNLFNFLRIWSDLPLNTFTTTSQWQWRLKNYDENIQDISFLSCILLPASVMEIKFTQMQENFRSLTYNELYKTKTFEQIRNFRMDFIITNICGCIF